MVEIALLLRGIPGRTDEGYLGQSSVAMVGGTTLVDTGSLARRPMLQDAFDVVDADPGDIEDVLLTHLHFDHCENLDLFENATVHVYEPELARVEAGEFDWATSHHVHERIGAHDFETFTEGEVIDGIEAVRAPGHVEHQVAYVVEADMTYGLTGDAVKNIREFETRNPTTLWDDDVAADTLDRLAERLDFVVPGHDTPFYVTEDGAQPCGDVELSVRMQMSADSETHVRVRSDRTGTHGLPESVRDVGPKQSFD